MSLLDFTESQLQFLNFPTDHSKFYSLTLKRFTPKASPSQPIKTKDSTYTLNLYIIKSYINTFNEKRKRRRTLRSSNKNFAVEL